MTRWQLFKAAIGVGNMSAGVYGETSLVSDHDGWFARALSGAGRSAAGVSVTEYTALNLPAVWACINRIANPIARFPIKILKPRAGGGNEEVTDHPMSQALALRPNEFMTSRTVRKTVQGHALLWGNGYLEIERNERGQAVQLWPMLPWTTSPVRDNTTGGRLKYRTNVDGRQTDVDGEDVIHIMDLSQDGYCGLSPIQRAAQALGLATAAETFGAKFFANDAKSGGFLLHPGKLGEAARKNLQAASEDQSGLRSAHRVRILEEGMKFIDTQIPPEAAQFLGTRHFQIAEIARLYDVPLIMLQSTENVTAWGSGIEQLLLGFAKFTVEPWINAWEQEFNWKLFTESERQAGYYVKFNMNALLRGDMAGRAAFYQTLWQMGVISPNWILDREDEQPIPPDEGGDAHFVPVNYQTLDQAIAEPPEPAPAGAVVMPTGQEQQKEQANEPPRILPRRKARASNWPAWG